MHAFCAVWFSMHKIWFYFRYPWGDESLIQKHVLLLQTTSNEELSTIFMKFEWLFDYFTVYLHKYYYDEKVLKVLERTFYIMNSTGECVLLSMYILRINNSRKCHESSTFIVLLQFLFRIVYHSTWKCAWHMAHGYVEVISMHVTYLCMRMYIPE